jgi:hypothetical protein
MQHTIYRCFHAAGTGGFLKTAGYIQPDVHPLDQIAGHMHIVIFHEGYAPLKFTVCSQGEDVLKKLLRRQVSRVRLASEDYLDRVPSITDNPLQAFHIMENQLGPLIGGKAADKADGQSIRIEQSPHSQHLMGHAHTFSGTLPCPLHHGVHKLALKNLTHCPEFLVGDI